ncbi:Alkaline phosphatase [Microcystis aeruginosa NIES-2549]|uniref:Alkaline phosphatase n=1 Tax=Microcystis aeruginosa NIES-2549 TaxID=1641812 RepID=A0A0F6RJB8_MICAE|nr:Calx-beta domain-containing protein [Microcystis aeruginosa]AKE62785.1 Alkaline phosphatase [Microcystis aeruginosa NIES-2549]
MTSSLLPFFPSVYDILFNFAQSDGFWANLETAFGTSYDVVKATELQQQWRSRNFSQLPPIEVLSDEVLGTANGAYSSSTNKIYLSASFLNTASSAAIINVILEEIGHYVDAQINQVDSAGDEGAIFAELVSGESLSSQQLQVLKLENDTAIVEIDGQQIQIEQMATNNLHFNITINDPLNAYSTYYAAIKSSIQASGSFWDNYIGGVNANLEVVVNFNNNIPTATGRSVTSSFVRNNGTFNIFEQGAAAEIKTGIDPNENEPDIEINLSPNYLINTLWFDSNPFTREGIVPNNKIDAVSVFMHELGHAFAFSGWMNPTTGTMPGNYQSIFDEKTYFDGTNFFFTGSQAVSIYGSSVPLTYGNISHLGNNSPRPGSDLISDLMNGVVYYSGQKYYISPLDVAILADTGVPVTFNLPVSVTLAVAPSSVTEDGTTNLVYTFTRTGSTTNPLTVNYTLGGTATLNTDYTRTGTNNTVTFAAGSSTATVTVDPTADTIVESNETVILTLAAGTGYTVGTTTPVTGTINNDDTSVTLAVSPASVTEDGTTNLVYTFTRSGVTTNALTVNYTLGGTATLNTDYTRTGTTNTVTFAAGSSTATVTVDPTADTTVEPDETVILTLASGTGYTIGTTTPVMGTITNDDVTLPSITLAVAPASVTEDGTANLIYTFTRSGVTTNPLTVNYTLGGTATLNTDYTRTGTTNTVTFAAGLSTATVIVDPTADTTVESDETVALTLASGTGYTVGTTTAVTGTITNDDVTLPSITLAVSPASVTEDGTTNLLYTFTRSGVTINPLTVNYTIGGTATLNTDYTRTGTTNTVTFAANSATATVTVDPTADTIVESNETVILTLASGTGYTVGTTTPVTGTITNDDVTLPSITLAVSPASVTEDGTTNLVYTFTRTGVTTNPLTVNYTLGGTATLNTDYTRTGTTNTVTFAANSATATVTVDPTADTIVESNETVILTLASGTGYTIGTTTAVTGTITNDDVTLPSITLAVSPASVTEDGTTNLVYTFTRSGVTINPLTVNYTIGGTGTLNTDYTRTGTNNTVTFAANSSTATVTVDPTADTTVEDDETVALTLTSGTGYTIGTTTAVTGTINNDDTSVTSQLSINDITVVEGKDNNAILTVTVDNPNSQPITFNYTTAPIDATANVDYTSKTGTITIAPNTATATISIPILNDNLNEPDEAFTVTLSNPVNATINPEGGIGEVIITDTWQSSLTRTLPNNVENLRLIGSNNINGTGNAGNNNITGNSGNNQINGRAGIDTLTGGLGADTFIFQFGQSTISTSDRITDFAINSDKIDLLTQGGTAMNAPSSFSRAADSTTTTLDNLVNQVFTDANGATTGNQGLAVSSAALVQVTTGAIAGTYLVINDSAAGFQSSNDLLINITGFTGTLPALGSIPVGNFFI